MSQYTLTIKQILDSDVTIFDFSYPIFDEEYRPVFEQNFINRFLFDEIGFETVGKFKHFLKTELNIIMPLYNKIYQTQLLEQRILDNYDITEHFEKSTTNTSNGNTEKDGTITNNSTNTIDTINKNLFSDTPKKRIDIASDDFVTTINKDTNNGTTTVDNTIVDINTITNIVNDNGTESWTRTMKGNMGVATDSDAIVSYWKSLRNVDEEILTKLEVLFMGVY